MKTYIALLRGINVGGQKKVPMAELRGLLKKLEFENLQTYIQSGNLVFDSEIEDSLIIEDKIQKAIYEGFGFDVSVIARPKKDFREIFSKNPFTDPDDIKNKRIYFALLREVPKKEKISEFQKLIFQNEKFAITRACVYLRCAIGYGKAKLNNNLVENKLKVAATTRNHNTMIKLLEMADGC